VYAVFERSCTLMITKPEPFDMPEPLDKAEALAMIKALMAKADPRDDLLLYTEQMRKFAEGMELGYLFYMAGERFKLHTDVELLDFCRKVLTSANLYEYQHNIAYIAGWMQALSHYEHAPKPPEGTSNMPLWNGGVVLTEGKNFERGYMAGQVAWSRKHRDPKLQECNLLDLLLAIKHSDRDERPLAEKVYDVGKFLGWYQTAVRKSKHFSRLGLKENVMPNAAS
jgi:hypothetical protein